MAKQAFSYRKKFSPWHKNFFLTVRKKQKKQTIVAWKKNAARKKALFKKLLRKHVLGLKIHICGRIGHKNPTS